MLVWICRVSSRDASVSHHYCANTAATAAKASYSGKAEGSGTSNLPNASGDKFQYVSFGQSNI